MKIEVIFKLLIKKKAFIVFDPSLLFSYYTMKMIIINFKVF